MIFDQLDQIEKQLGQADVKKWEILCDSSTAAPVLFEYDKLKEIGYREASGVGLRIIHEGRIGFTSTSNPDRFSDLPAAALASAAYGEKATFDFPSQPIDGRINTYDESTAQVSSETLIERGEKMVSMIKEEIGDVQAQVEFHPNTHSRLIRNSTGLDAMYETTGLGVSVEGILVEGDSILSVYDSHESCRDDALIETMAIRVIERVRMAREVTDFPSGGYPVLFTPKASASLFMGIQMGTNGRLVQKGASPLTERIDQSIVDPRIMIVDDPFLEMKPGSRPFDAEGIASQRNTVIEGGVLKQFLFDLQTAGRMNAKSTGNAVRGYSGPPSPAWTNLVMDPGTDSVEDLVAGMKQGILVDQVLGAGQSNLLMGEFSVNVSLGFRVEKGEIQGRVKNLMVAGNVYEALSNVESFSREQEYTHHMLLPSILFGRLQIASRA
ncbi:MAG: metallopeptidase TldD-related protein [bacterium]